MIAGETFLTLVIIENFAGVNVREASEFVEGKAIAGLASRTEVVDVGLALGDVGGAGRALV